jgi:hypothetical protein
MLHVTEVCSRMTAENERRRDRYHRAHVSKMPGSCKGYKEPRTRPTTGIISCPSGPFERDKARQRYIFTEEKVRTAVIGVAHVPKSRIILIPVRPGA